MFSNFTSHFIALKFKSFNARIIFLLVIFLSEHSFSQYLSHSQLYQSTALETNTTPPATINEKEKINWNDLYEFFFYSQKKLISQPMLSIEYGLSNFSLPTRIYPNSLPISNYFKLEYGFARIDSFLQLYNLRGYSSEFVFIEDNTNAYGLINTGEKNIYSNIFSFGFGLRSGYGIDLFQTELYGLHTTAFIWSYYDYASYEPNDFFRAYDDNWKFGNKGETSIEYRFSKNAIVSMNYMHINMYSDMEYWKWLGSWGIDILLQRWIDFFDPIFIDYFGYTYPVLKFFYKNAISIIFTEARGLKQFSPFNSDYSLIDRRLGVELKFIF